MPDTNLVGQTVCHPVPTDCNKAGHAAGEVFVLARIKAEYAPTVVTKLINVNHIIPNYGGTTLGIADKVKVLECGLSEETWKHQMSMVVIQFPSLELAMRWSQSDPIFRDKDFPTHGHRIEMIAVPLIHIPPPGFKTFQITTFLIQEHNAERFQQEYIAEAAKFYHKHKICYGVALTSDIKDMRPGWIEPRSREYFAIHMFANESVLETLYKDSEYEALKSLMNSLSVSTTISFTVT